eukprot:327341_1
MLYNNVYNTYSGQNNTAQDECVKHFANISNTLKIEKNSPIIRKITEKYHGIDLNEMDICNRSLSIQKEKEIIKKCIAYHNITVKGNSLLYKESMDICSHKYSLTNIGSNHINKIMINYVKARQEELYNEFGLKLLIFDAYKIFHNFKKHCDIGNDAIHYPGLYHAQLMAFINVINEWC